MKLVIGHNPQFEVRNEHSPASSGAGLSVLYLSDLHFNKYSGAITANIITEINKLDPSVILFGGDYADSKKGLTFLNELMGTVAHRQHVFAVAGNHDHFRLLNEIKAIISAHKITWLEKESVVFTTGNTTVQVDGNKPGAKQTGVDIAILCQHKPIAVNMPAFDYNMVFAGHLHGSQVVWWQKGNDLYPGKLFYKWNMLGTRLGNTQYFISKGLGDTLPLRYNCKKDMIFVTVSPITL